MPANSKGRQILHWSAAWLLLCLPVFFASSWLAPLPAKAGLITQACSLLGLGYLFYPGWSAAKLTRRSLLLWGALLALAMLAMALLEQFSLLLAGKAALAVFLLNLCMQSLSLCLGRRGLRRPLAGLAKLVRIAARD